MSTLRVNSIQNSSGSTFPYSPGMLVQRQITVFTSEVQFNSTSHTTIFTASQFTPRLSSSRIYITANIHHGKRAAGEHQFSNRVLRNGTVVTQNASSTDAVAYDVMRYNIVDLHRHSTYYYYDEPGSTSPITYTWQAAVPTAGFPTIFFNFSSNTGRSAIIIEEIAQ